MEQNGRIQALIAAFAQDGFDVTSEDVVHFERRVGLRAKHNTAYNYETGEKKRAYYVEGSHYQMGYLLGLLAEPEIAQMTNDFVNKVVPAFVGGTKREGAEERSDLTRARHSLVIELLEEVMKRPLQVVRSHTPARYTREIHGILDGCKAAKSDTKVTEEGLWLLNSAVDCLVALVYTGKIGGLRRYRSAFGADLLPQELNIPIMCNGFAVFGDAADSHYFGRDYMFPTAGVFQDTACMVIYNPSNEDEDAELPVVSVTAPGIVGSIAVMNSKGVAGGVDMSPAGNCNVKDPGRNLLILLRQSIAQGSSAEAAVDTMVEAPRGSTWNYIIADGANDRACVVEAGMSVETLDFLSFPPRDLLRHLPDQDFLDAHRSADFKNGLMVRWNDYEYPRAYVDTFNRRLWRLYNADPWSDNIRLYPDAFEELGYINKTSEEHNCPKSFYFAPQRERREDVVLAINHFIVPEMRFCGMWPFTTRVAAHHLNDIQWRYDELNYQILVAIRGHPNDESLPPVTSKPEQVITYDTAKDLIDFLAPDKKFPHYYAGNPKSTDGKATMIGGSVSLFDLKKLTVETHFGYFCDDWIKLSLKGYLGT